MAHILLSLFCLPYCRNRQHGTAVTQVLSDESDTAADTVIISRQSVVGKSQSRFDLNRDLTAISDSI